MISLVRKYAKCLFLITLCGFLSTNIHAEMDRQFSVKAFGSFSNMIHTDDTSGHISLYSLQGVPHLHALGALEGLRGEVIIIDGKVFISRGFADDGHVEKVLDNDKATILATAKVKDWHLVSIPPNLDQVSFEKFVLEKALQLGFSMNSPFPFMVKGETKNLGWHVINGLIPLSQRVDSHAVKKKFKENSANGTLLGFYTGEQLEGVVSHIGKRFHVHYADANFAHAGHVDTYEIGNKATLWLPKA